jgi:hypothetical protein
MRLACRGAAIGLLLTACQYEVTPEIPDASGPFSGGVTLTWAPTSWAVTANFTEPQFADGGCLGTQIGSCCAYSQPAIDLSAGGTEPITLSAGNLGIDDGATPIGALTFAGLGYLPLSSAENPGVSWNPGDTLSVSADGGLVQAFFGAITAPPAFTGVTPALSLTGQVVISLAQDFTASWAPSVPGGGPSGETITLSLFDPSGFYVDCSAADESGSVTVPASALSSFLPGDNGYVTLIRSASVQLSPPDATVVLTAQATAPGLAHFR